MYIYLPIYLISVLSHSHEYFACSQIYVGKPDTTFPCKEQW